jgi:hypothetical protein
MTCNAQQTLVFNGIKGKQIDLDKIPSLPIYPAPASLKTWYRNSNENIQYVTDADTSSGIYVTYNLNEAPAIGCNKNPVELCDPCIVTIGTLTDTQINEALGTLPFKSSGSEIGTIALIAIGIGALYLMTRK